MATKGFLPPAASPPAKVTACPSEIPTSKALSGISLNSLPIDVPESIPAVMPVTDRSLLASSTRVCPNTSCHSGASSFDGFESLSPVSGLNFPGACHVVGFSSAGL